MIDIKLLNKKLLIEYIDSEEFNMQEFVPITKHRALSHAQNPRSEDKDVLLLLAYKKKKLIGYLGVLPDKIYFNNKIEKIGWLSCLWVAPTYRGNQIAQLLLDKCFEAWGKKIIATEFTTTAKKLYDQANVFHNLQIKKGIRLYIRFDLYNLLPPRKKVFEQIAFFLKAVDFITNSLLNIRFLFWKTKMNDLHVEYVNHLDKEIENFISDKQEHQLFKRGLNELNWIIKNPWVLSAPAKDVIGNKYAFSSSDKSFNFYALKVRGASNQLVAFLIFSKRNQTLKMPYCYHNNNLETVINVINFHLHKWKIKTFTTFYTEIADYFSKNKTPALFKRELKRHYIISTVFGNSIQPEEFEIQDGDGDCSFT